MFLANISIRAKQFIIVFLGVCSAIVVGIIAYQSTQTILAQSSRIKEDGDVVYAQAMADMMHDALRGDFLSALLAEHLSAEDKASALKEFNDHAENFRQQLTIVRSKATAPEVQAALATVNQPLDEYINTGHRLIELALNNHEAAMNEKDAFEQKFKALEEPMEHIATLIDKQSDKTEQESNALGAATNQTILMVVGISAAICFVLGWFISSRITKPLMNLSTVAEKIASGDYSQLVTVSSRDEVGKLSENFNTMVESINAAQEQTQREKQKAELLAAEAEQLARNAEEQSQYLSHSVETIVGAMNHFAKGDLSVQLPVQGNDAIAQLSHGFNQSVDNIRIIIENVKNAIEAAASSGAQISAGTEEMSVGAREQSNQVSEVAAAMEEMSRTIDDNAQLAGKTSQIAQSSRHTALEGGKVIEESISKVKDIARSVETVSVTIGQLGERSKEIGQIVSTIKEIADQTNLLALNAAIEAARAGEQGRGFAVVADEVRKLAERTQSSTKEIEMKIGAIQGETMQAVEMMGKSMSLVQEGISLSDGAGRSLTSIVNSVEQVVETVDMIAKANSEQAVVGATVARNIENISNVSSEMARGLGDVANATTSLSQMTQNLQSLASQFKIESSPSHGLIHNNAYRHSGYVATQA